MIIEDQNEKITSVLEYIAFNLLVEKGYDTDFPQIFVLSLKETKEYQAE